MEYLLTAGEMKACDQEAINGYGIWSPVLMERAAYACVEELEKARPEAKRFLIVCGSGNNGGDGFAIARILKEKKKEPVLFFCGKDSSMTEETRAQRKICKKLQIPEVTGLEQKNFDVVVDAIFGVGLSREVSGIYRELIEELNSFDAFRFAVDIPSGISADSGKILGCAFAADLTVTFAWKKRGHVFYPGAALCGKVICRKIGIPEEILTQRMAVRKKKKEDEEVFASLDREDLLKLLPKRDPNGNKGTFGKVLVAAGCETMIGAAFFAAKAAAKTGCGMVRILTEEHNRSALYSLFPEALYTFWNADERIEEALVSGALSWADQLVLGPGLGEGEGDSVLIPMLLNGTDQPVVLDADALNLLAKKKELWELVPKNSVITPHIGEMSRLLGIKTSRLLEAKDTYAKSFAREHGVIVVLKDARTIITDGYETYVNTSGNDGMATAGSGDVLAGMIGSLMAQGMEPLAAAAAGVFLHGIAGDTAVLHTGKAGLLASDLISAISLTNLI